MKFICNFRWTARWRIEEEIGSGATRKSSKIFPIPPIYLILNNNPLQQS